jgi:DNA-binding protein WhiA
MPLSDDVRAELAAIAPRRACCRLAELSALVRGGGSVHLLGGGRVEVSIELSSGPVARRAFSLLRSFGVPCEVRTYRQRAFERGRRFQLALGDEPRALQALNEAGVLDARLAPLERPPRRVVGRACCRAAHLRGAFLAAGSVTGPRQAHLELRAASLEGAEALADLARESGFDLRVHARDRHAIAYAKGRDPIAGLLAFLGAHEAALSLEEAAVVAATRGRANRLANADHANLRRTSRAADQQLRAIRELEAQGLLADLPRELREIGDLRRRHPSLPLSELARRCRPPTTKAGAHRRLARLQRLANSL